MDYSQNTNRLAKNTMLLYIRMFVSMVISLYTSRVILDALGVEDYGTYNVVGGLVGMFGIITATLNTAVNRFLTFELGKGDISRLKRVFSTSLTIQVVLSIIILLLTETIGVWYVNNVMVVPADRLIAANFCFQFSVITCVIGLVIVPFNSVIIAHEHMSVYAYMGIFTSFFALFIALLIPYSPIDKLVFYGAMLLFSSILTFIVYVFYCRHHFEETSLSLTYDKEFLRTMFGFAGWNFIGAGSGILRDYGGNLLINYYFGPAINAARGISNSVNVAITQFSTNFTVALNPQITKSYASGDHEYMFRLLFRGSKLSVFMMLFVSVPVLLNTQFILSIWLKEVPEHAALFTQLTIIYTLVELVSTPLVTSMLATGKIRNYQIIVGGVQCFNIPIAWLLLHLGCIPEITVIVSIFIAHCTFAARLIMLRTIIGLDSKEFLIKVYGTILVTSAIGVSIPLLIHYMLPLGWTNFIITSICSVITMGGSMYYVGFNNEERVFLRNSISKFFSRFK